MPAARAENRRIDPKTGILTGKKIFVFLQKNAIFFDKPTMGS
jgi:hypothetical protein